MCPEVRKIGVDLWRSAVVAVAVSALQACSSFSSLPPLPAEPRAVETASPPATAPLWTEVEEVRRDNWNILLNDGATALDWRLTAIDSATQSLDLQTFLWSLDRVGSAMLNHLLAAADRGVRVRLLVDDSFLLGEDDLLLALAEHPNIAYRVFNPYKRRQDGFATREAMNLGDFDRLNHRMHNKVMLVDNRVAIVGGRNLADEYFGLHEEANFRDMELLVGGDIVPSLSAVFDDYWNDLWSVPIEALAHRGPNYERLSDTVRIRDPELLAHSESEQPALLLRWRTAVKDALPGEPELLVDTPPPADITAESSAPMQLAQELIEVFDSAREEVIVISAYLIPSPGLEAVVERAARRGVRIRILTNSIRSNNHITAHSAYRNHIGELMEDGAELHEVRIDAGNRTRYMLSPVDKKALALHAKVLVIDGDRVFVGSPNLDPRSMRINTEVGLLVRSEALNERIRESVEPDLSQANAWSLQLDESNRVVWVAEGQTLSKQPAASFMQRLEDWFFAHLPIEGQM
ncbi:Phosphatidylserine/phosphatidylglycerophosphate/cardiolipin synthase [Congregibacter litoralis KT71]|uniref:Phosphatidylserine/phosphatidylglycerophosphate/ cardiolipin synthase n=1 Tax=Congregibacter litoralis KT71 TaxID=314285 RepID=A4A7E3_9GAMM|nr:Phosphatidylserine/phosphatidylglycerophosphate/cardiolipin synthase [Congregibacter litoralis KT71]